MKNDAGRNFQTAICTGSAFRTMVFNSHFVFAALFLLILPLLISSPVFAKEYQFALIPKSTTNAFFKPSEKGCLDAAATLKSVTCLFRGSEKFDFRLQNQIIDRLVEEGIDGIALSVTHSNFLVNNSIRRALNSGIPIITFDSDFDGRDLAENPGIRVSYIGTDNFAMGKALGKRLKEHKPEGGSVCIISGRKDTPNLQQRVRGIRASLSGNEDQQDAIAFNQRLSNSGLWHEHSRCPFHTHERPDATVSQMKAILDEVGKDTNAADALIVVGLWPQLSKNYASVLNQYKTILDQKEIVILMSDTMPFQLPFIDLGLSHGNIGQRPYSMGYKAIQVLYNIVHNHPVDEIIYTPLTYCHRGNLKDCIQ